MKKTFLLLTLLLLSQTPLLAQNKGDDENQNSAASTVLSPWYMGIGLGVTAPVQDWDPSYSLGAGGLLFFGCRLNSLLALQWDLNPWFFTGNGQSIYDYRSFLDLRFFIPGPGVNTYFFLGPGYDVQVDNPNVYSTSSFAAVGGLGFQFDLRPGEHLFVEGRYNILFYKNLTQQDVPVFFGLSEDL